MKQKGILYNNGFITVDDIEKHGFFEGRNEWERKLFGFVVDWFSNSDCVMQKTSGSTGKPKLIGLKKKAMTASALKTIHRLGLKQGDTCWLCLPVEYIAGKMMVVRAITAGMNLLATAPGGTPEIPDQTIDFAALVPLQLDNLLDKTADLSQIRRIIIGGSSVGYNLKKKIQHLNSEVYSTYGMTETCSHIALQRINGLQPDAFYVPLPGVMVYIDGHGCLVIEAPELLPSSIVTTDLAEVNARNGFKILGRADNVINSGGIKILPEPLENEISQVIDRECLIVPFPDDKLGQKVVLVLEKTALHRFADEKALWMALKTNLKKYEVPKQLIRVDGFVRKDNYKIDRLATLKHIQEMF